ncbi:MAG: hypothetical protein ACYC5Y_14925 [Symbiobacteriia bacterium]
MSQPHDAGHGDSEASHGHHPGWPMPASPFGERPTGFWARARQFLWGLFFFEYYHELKHERERYADVMNVVLFGELLGLPLMNTSLGLKLLPYTLPELPGWLHRQSEDHEVLEDAPHIH